AQEVSMQLQQELAVKVTLSAEKSEVAGQLEQQRIENDLKWSAVQAEKEQLIAKAEALKDELAQVRAEATRKDQDNAGTVKSMRDMQAFAMSTNERLTAENKALAVKLASIEASSKALEKESSESTTTIQRLQATIEALEAAKSDAIALAKEKSEACLAATNEAQEQLRIAYAETEKRGLLDAQLREVRTELQACMAQLQATKAELKRQADEHKMGLERDANVRTNLEQTHHNALQVIMAEMDRFREEKVTLESELNTWKTKWHETQENKNMVEMAALCKAQSEAEVYKMRLNEAQNSTTQSLEAKNQLIAELTTKVKEGEALRRKMHNQIQELRGNVRVFARARPFLPCDGSSLESSIVCDTENQSLTIKVPQRDPEQYTFDRVFAPIAGQDTVFEEVSEFVQSAVDGYQVCLFSYGQTGSGKTHTMQGSGNGEMRGIIPRSIKKVLEECERKNEHGWKYTLQASYLEIYNETVRDLLAPRSPTEDPKSLEISMNKNKGKGVHVPGLKMVPISMIEDVERLVERASRTRSVSATDMNEHSSRSHSVFTLYLSGVNPELHVALEGRLNLVDLAGSERISRSGATGDRLKEAQAINKSLSCLTDVFRAIAAQKTEKNVHIPFRNSKLTYLLQSCLSGDGKTLMMVNLSPTLESANETLCSLRFARDVNKCELGRAKKHLSSTT
ncbi:kinesin, partial [Thraustotheca clavata]